VGCCVATLDLPSASNLGEELTIKIQMQNWPI